MRLAHKAAIVTGATRGIGRAIALAFASEGADVLVVGRDAAAGNAVCSAIEALGRRGVWHQADLGRAGEAGRMVDAAIAAFGHLDVLVNNAGLFQRKPVLEIEEADWDRLMDVNLKAAFFCAQAAARAMVAGRGSARSSSGGSDIDGRGVSDGGGHDGSDSGGSGGGGRGGSGSSGGGGGGGQGGSGSSGGGGAIVNVASDAAWSGGLNPCAHYAASKAGLLSITRSLARELAGRGVRVNALAPGMIDTDMGSTAGSALPGLPIPIGRYGTPDEVATAAVFLASAEASYMTGAVLNLSGGLFLDR